MCLYMDGCRCLNECVCRKKRISEVCSGESIYFFQGLHIHVLSLKKIFLHMCVCVYTCACTWELGYFTGVCVNRLMYVSVIMGCICVLWVGIPHLCSHESVLLKVCFLPIRWKRSQRWPWHTWSWPPRRNGSPWNTRYESSVSQAGWTSTIEAGHRAVLLLVGRGGAGPL